MKRCEVDSDRKGEGTPGTAGFRQLAPRLFGLLVLLGVVALPALGTQIRLPQGQMVRVKLHNVLTTENVEKDDTIDFDVADDVMIGNRVVIAKGAPANAKVIRVKGAGKKKAKDASVTFRFIAVRAIDNTTVPLRLMPTKGKKSDSKENEIEVSSPIPGLAERMVGAEKGHEFAAYTDTDTIVDAPDTPAPAPAVSTAQPTVPMGSTGTQPSAPAAAPAGGAASSLAGLGTGSDPASVDFTSDPTGADILIDGSFVGNTPSTLHVAPGRRVIELRLGGYRSWTRTMTVEPASHPTIRATLDKE